MTDIPPISVIQAQLGIGIKRDSKNWGKMQCIDHCIFPYFFWIKGLKLSGVFMPIPSWSLLWALILSERISLLLKSALNDWYTSYISHSGTTWNWHKSGFKKIGENAVHWPLHFPPIFWIKGLKLSGEWLIYLLYQSLHLEFSPIFDCIFLESKGLKALIQVDLLESAYSLWENSLRAPWMTDIPPISVIQAQLGIGIKWDSKTGENAVHWPLHFPYFLESKA